MNTLNGQMLDTIEQDLLRIGRELAATHALLTAARFIAIAGANATRKS